MSNEAIFFTLLFLVLATTLLAFRLGRGYLFTLVACEVALLNVFALKQFDLFGLAINGGIVFSAGIFLAINLLNEFYGKKFARHAVWAGLGAGVFLFVGSSLTTAFAPNTFDNVQSALASIFTPGFRLVAASLASYFIFQTFGVWFYDLLKKATNGRQLWLRNSLSMILAQTGDTIFFTVVGRFVLFVQNPELGSSVTGENFGRVVAFALIVKILIAISATPVMYFAQKVKHEGLGIAERIRNFLD